MIHRLIDWTDPAPRLPRETLEHALVPCCALRCAPGSVCATDHHGPERERYNLRIHGTVEPYRLDDVEAALAGRLRGAA